MKCPKCHTKMKCSCRSCFNRNLPTPGRFWMDAWNGDDTTTCGQCGFAAHVDWWADYEVELMKAAGKWPVGGD